MLNEVNEAFKAMDRARQTPVVDDDFPGLLHEADRLMAVAIRKLAGFPKIVCLCGSTRFYDAFQEANYRETMAGNIVLSVGFAGRLQKQRVIIDGCMGQQETEVLVARSGETVGCTPEQKKALDSLHLRKIDLADEVLILNVGGYVGESTARELAHARKIGKPVRFLEERVEVMA
jgi:hypothetical protein